MFVISTIKDNQVKKENGGIQGEGIAASEAAYYVSPHIHPLLSPRLPVLLSSCTGTLCDTAVLSVEGAWC